VKAITIAPVTELQGEGNRLGIKFDDRAPFTSRDGGQTDLDCRTIGQGIGPDRRNLHRPVRGNHRGRQSDQELIIPPTDPKARQIKTGLRPTCQQTITRLQVSLIQLIGSLRVDLPEHLQPNPATQSRMERSQRPEWNPDFVSNGRGMRPQPEGNLTVPEILIDSRACGLLNQLLRHTRL
jgi:hypothetical protein